MIPSTVDSMKGSNFRSVLLMKSGFNKYPHLPLYSKIPRFSCIPRSEITYSIIFYDYLKTLFIVQNTKFIKYFSVVKIFIHHPSSLHFDEITKRSQICVYSDKKGKKMRKWISNKKRINKRM